MLRRALLSALLLGLLAPTSAFAWTSITTNGQPLWWTSGNPETTWHLSSSHTSDDLGNSSVDSALAAAMNEWAVPGCTSFNASQGSDRSGDPVNDNQNENLVGFTAQWPAAYGATTLAVTVPVFYGDGEIIRASMTINELNYEWITGTPAYWDEADLQAIGAHEFGHWIGFDHNTYSGSTLTAYYSGGTGERTLTCDDTEGVCSKYTSSSNSCTDDRYCACGVGCNDGTCGGVPADDDDATGGDDDDVVTGECSGPAENFDESEPNDWQGEDDVDYATPGGGDLTISGSIDCGNNGEGYTGDADWFVVDFPCQEGARFNLDWSGSNSDLDFYVWTQTGDELTNSATAEMSGPVSSDAFAGGRLFFLIACWEGSSTSYDFTVDWLPFGASGDDDDDATAPPDDDDDDVVSDDDDAVDDDDDAADDDDDGGGGGSSRRGGCSCDLPSSGGSGALALVIGLAGLGLRRRRG